MTFLCSSHFWTLFFFLFVTVYKSKLEAGLSYTSNYPSSNGSYLLNGQELTLICTYNVEEFIYLVYWYIDGDRIARLYYDGFDVPVHEHFYTSRFVNTSFSFSPGVSRLTVTLNKTSDEGSLVGCEVLFDDFFSISLTDIFVQPQLVTLGSIPYVIEGAPITIQCQVPSVYKGKSVTEFRIKVGETYLPTTGSKYDSSGEVNGTYTVIYTQLSEFTYNVHQGQQVQCDVTWMKGTSVEKVVTSDPQTLEVYYTPASVFLDISQSSVISDDAITFSCTTASNPYPIIRLYKRAQDQSVWISLSVEALTLSQTLSMRKSDNQAEFWCRVYDDSSISGWDFDLQSETKVINVMYAPEVTVKTQPSLVLEGSELILECEVDSNPTDLSVLKWQFNSKYNNSQSVSFLTQRDNKEIRIERVEKNEAGIYTCTAGNDIGVGKGEKQIDVHYSPKLVSKDDLLVSSLLNHLVNLSVTVMAFPEFTDIDTAFRWTRTFGQELPVNTIVSSLKIMPEVFQSTLEIGSVTKEDYGDYIITVDNGIKEPVSLILTLVQTEIEVQTDVTVGQEKSTLTTGTTVGVVLTVLLVIGLLTVLVFWYIRNHRIKGSHRTSSGHRMQSVQEENQQYEGLDHGKSETKESSYAAIQQTNQTEEVAVYVNQAVALSTVDVTVGTLYEDVNSSNTGYTSNQLRTSRLIHKGRYTNILKGTLTYKGAHIAVIVKCNKENILENETLYLFNTVSCMQKLSRHPNVAETFDVKDVPTKLVMKYYEAGDLKQFLTQNNGAEKPQGNTEVNLLQLAVTAIRGLAFLDKQEPGILHYQLCAEHVLVDQTQSCRLTGFDFKHHVLRREMEEEDEGFYGAIEWKAPEVMHDCKAHCKSSDVWAFGVLLYEIYTRGGVPYEGMPECDIKTFVKCGDVLSPPANCPVEIYDIMKSCWAYTKNKRPSFQKLLEQLENIRTSKHMLSLST